MRRQQKLPIVTVAQFPPTTLVLIILYLFINFFPSFTPTFSLCRSYTIGSFVATNTYTHINKSTSSQIVLLLMKLFPGAFWRKKQTMMYFYISGVKCNKSSFWFIWPGQRSSDRNCTQDSTSSFFFSFILYPEQFSVMWPPTPPLPTNRVMVWVNAA